ncbi:MAG: BamA/TamA family outer membrane protein [Bacteroidales bacterium]|jgi:outer membrane protein insertion porin family|nr:BamA/TamA family outer membrane protein [Bacteroidales bacterium]MCI2145330.1 BamA/TamA family outer membrane protein [Bacteroidales bacterium]
MKRFCIIVCLLFSVTFSAIAQEGNQTSGIVVDYDHPKTYTVGALRVKGVKYIDESSILSITGIQPGEKLTVPSQDLSQVVKRLWLQKRFSSVGLTIDSLGQGDTAYFSLVLAERERVSAWIYKGVKNSERDDLKDKLHLRKGQQLSEYVKQTSVDLINDYYHEKGYLKSNVEVQVAKDSMIANAVRVTFDVTKGPKVRIKAISYSGQGDDISKFKLDKSMKKTKDKSIYNLFSSKKFNEKEYPNDKQSLVSVFNEKGYRDAKIEKDSVYYMTPNRLGIHIDINRGKKYYFRNITWTGNSVYSGEALSKVMMIKKGDIYDVVTMEKRLFGGGKENELSISKLYRDQGYLFFNVQPVELNIVGDSVDVEMRIVEGEPATFNHIIINGNTLTNEKVVRRAIFTRPGYLFRQTDFERSIREIASMGTFEPEKAASEEGYNIMPNPVNNTVDIAYNVVEKPSSQFELSGGWGANTFVGTLGVSFNNFSSHNLFNKEAWRPVPLGDAQTLSLRFQTNGTYYTALTASFVEPWLTGVKPISLQASLYYTKQTNSYASYYYTVLNSDEYMEIYGAQIGIGARLKWPDNYFVLYNGIGWQSYSLKDWNYNFIFSTGVSHNISYTVKLSRDNTDQSIYPRSGSSFELSLQLTPPYSLFRSADTDYSSMTDQEKYNWIEYHKWELKGSVFSKLIGDLVLMTRAQFGYLGYYNRKLGYSPFEGFLVGGDGMTGYNTYGSEVIGLRGYDNYSLTPYVNSHYAGNVYDKFTVELRYPVVMQGQSTIYALTFLEGGNCWSDIVDFNPFEIKRSAGVGIRVQLPVVGLLGVDWGWGFDNTGSDSKSHFHFLIGQQF